MNCFVWRDDVTSFVSELIFLTFFASQHRCEFVRGSNTVSVRTSRCLVYSEKFHTKEGFLLNVFTTNVDFWINSDTKIVFTNSFLSSWQVPWSCFDSSYTAITKFRHCVFSSCIDETAVVFLVSNPFKNRNTSFVCPVCTVNSFTVFTKQSITNRHEQWSSVISVHRFEGITKCCFSCDGFIVLHIIRRQFTLIIEEYLWFNTKWESISFTIVLCAGNRLLSCLFANFFSVIIWNFLDNTRFNSTCYYSTTTWDSTNWPSWSCGSEKTSAAFSGSFLTFSWALESFDSMMLTL